MMMARGAKNPAPNRNMLYCLVSSPVQSGAQLILKQSVSQECILSRDPVVPSYCFLYISNLSIL